MANPLNHIVVGKRKVVLFILNKRYVSRIYMNKICIYEKGDISKLSLEKEIIFLNKENDFQDTNQVFTNTEFSVK